MQMQPALSAFCAMTYSMACQVAHGGGLQLCPACLQLRGFSVGWLFEGSRLWVYPLAYPELSNEPTEEDHIAHLLVHTEIALCLCVFFPAKIPIF